MQDRESCHAMLTLKLDLKLPARVDHSNSDSPGPEADARTMVTPFLA